MSRKETDDEIRARIDTTIQSNRRQRGNGGPRRVAVAAIPPTASSAPAQTASNNTQLLSNNNQTDHPPASSTLSRKRNQPAEEFLTATATDSAPPLLRRSKRDHNVATATATDSAPPLLRRSGRNHNVAAINPQRNETKVTGLSKSKKLSVLMKPRTGYIPSHTGADIVASAGPTTRSGRSTPALPSATEATATKFSYEFVYNPSLDRNIPIMPEYDKKKVTVTIESILEMFPTYGKDENKIVAVVWDVVKEMNDNDAAFLPNGDGYRFDPQKKELLVKNINKRWKAVGNKKNPWAESYLLAKLGFKFAEHLKKPVKYKGEMIADFRGIHYKTREHILKVTNARVSHICVYRDNLSGFDASKNGREVACSLQHHDEHSKKKRDDRKKIWLAFCEVNPGKEDRKKVNAGLDPFIDDLVE